MAGKRVLFLGITGIEKSSALSRLQAWIEQELRRKPRVVDFEHDFLFDERFNDGTDKYDFLDLRAKDQRRIWRLAWDSAKTELLQRGDEDIFLAVHGTVVRGHFGVRGIADQSLIVQDFQPDVVITLVDEVYDMWWRTMHRSEGFPSVGQPTLEQLLFARRTELLIGDLISTHGRNVPHFLISTSHPCQTASNLIYASKPLPAYLCFPISAPRDMKAAGDPSGEQEVNAFLKKAFAFQQATGKGDLVFFCPLTIDELPLKFASERALPAQIKQIPDPEEAGKTIDALVFDREAERWPLDQIFDQQEAMTAGPPPVANRVPIPLKQIKDAAGMIWTDVGWRDYRLVEQSRVLLAFNPKFRNRDKISRSVLEEINEAQRLLHQVLVCQEPAHDPDGVLRKRFPTGATMGPGVSSKLVNTFDNLDGALDSLGKRLQLK